jgi:FAD/FMN-containing dehydrogenase
MPTDHPTFPGSTVTSGDPRYATLVRGFNQRWVGRPQHVQVVGNAEQIVETVQRCVNENLRPTVRSGGHYYEGWVSLNDGEVDLAWGHTGGGGNFGVITKYLFRKLPEAPSEAWLASLSWEWSDLLKHPD